MNVFQDINNLMEKLGVYDVVLPFLLVFTVIFAFLEKVQIFGKDAKNKKYHMVIALALGLLSVRLPVYVNIINSSLPKIAIIVIALLMYFILVSMFSGPNYENHFTKHMSWIVWVLFAVVGWAFLSSITDIYVPAFITENLPVIITLAAFGAVIAFIINDGGSSKPKKTSTPVVATSVNNEGDEPL